MFNEPETYKLARINRRGHMYTYKHNHTVGRSVLYMILSAPKFSHTIKRKKNKPTKCAYLLVRIKGEKKLTKKHYFFLRMPTGWQRHQRHAYVSDIDKYVQQNRFC